MWNLGIQDAYTRLACVISFDVCNFVRRYMSYD